MIVKRLIVLILLCSSHLILMECLLYLWTSDGIIVVGDSRCCGLVGPLSDEGIKCFAYRGAGIRTITLKARELVKTYNPTACLLLCGINDATVMNCRTRVINPRFEDAFDLANYILRLILEARAELVRIFPHTRFIFGGIIGVSLNTYNKLPGVSPLQDIIDDMITQVNSYLRILNQLVLVAQPRLTSKVHCWCKGTRKNYYHLLYDGLHLGPLLRDTWIREIIGFHRRNSANVSQYLGSNNCATVNEHS